MAGRCNNRISGHGKITSIKPVSSQFHLFLYPHSFHSLLCYLSFKLVYFTPSFEKQLLFLPSSPHALCSPSNITSASGLRSSNAPSALPTMPGHTGGSYHVKHSHKQCSTHLQMAQISLLMPARQAVNIPIPVLPAPIRCKLV